MYMERVKYFSALTRGCVEFLCKLENDISLYISSSGKPSKSATIFSKLISKSRTCLAWATATVGASPRNIYSENCIGLIVPSTNKLKKTRRGGSLINTESLLT